MTDIYTSQIVPKLHVRDMYVAGTVAGMTSEDRRTDGRTDGLFFFTYFIPFIAGQAIERWAFLDPEGLGVSLTNCQSLASFQC